jgi:GDPmannose 4,6-dehydratase
MPEYSGDITALGTTRLLEAVRRSGIKTKYYQASSSEMFGLTPPPQSEKSPFYPRSPYAAAKLYAYWMAVNYREGYDLFACNGILFNHESPRRGETFVSRKVTRAIANILTGRQKRLYLGNLNAKRDWGFAPEYIEVMWLILQQHVPDDYVIGTGQSYSVRELVEKAFAYAGIEIVWRGKDVGEKGMVRSVDTRWKPMIKSGEVIIEIDPRYFRPTEVENLKADITKAREQLGWEPRTTFDELIKIMMDYDLKMVRLEPPGEGIRISREKGFGYTNHDFSFAERIRERS